MKLLFKQRVFSFLGSYDIYGEDGETLYTVKGKIGLGRRFNVFDSSGNLLGEIKEIPFRLYPRFQLYVNGQLQGSVVKKFRAFEQKFDVDFNGWSVSGNFMGWDYGIYDSYGNQIAQISKQLFKFTDTYVIDVANPDNALCALMLTVAIDAEKSDNSAARS